MEREKLNKKQIIPLVIGVLTLVILVSSATYAYFSVTSGKTASSTTITGDIGGGTLGTITLDGGGTNLYLGLSAYDMSESKAGTTYYSSTTQGSRETNVNNAGKTTYTATLSGDESDSVMYACDYEFTVTSSGTAIGQESINDIELVFNGDINKTITLTGTDKVSGTWYGFKNSNKEREFNAYLQLTNTEVEQNDLAGKNISVEISNTKWKCYLSENDELVGEAYALLTMNVDNVDSYDLTFVRSETPYSVGDTYNDQTITAVYTGFEEESYTHENNAPWSNYSSDITGVVFEDEIRPISTSGWFRSLNGYGYDSQIDFSKLNTSLVTNMSYMFAGAMIGSLDLSAWDVSSVVDMSHMFDYFSAYYWISETDTLNLSGWDVSNVKNMAYMFDSIAWDSAKSVIGLESWNVSSVIDMSNMFHGSCIKNDLELYNWDVSNVTDMSYMFSYDVYGLNNIGFISSWDVSNVTDMSYMFYNAMINIDLDLSKWNVSNVIDMSYMFSDVSINTDIDMSNWNTSNVTNMSYMFSHTAINKDIGISNFNTSKVTNMTGMFAGATINTDIDLSGWNTSNVTNMSYMFSHTAINKDIGISNWDTSNVISMSHMFYVAGEVGTPKINVNIDLSKWNVSKVTDYTNFAVYSYSDGEEFTERDISAITPPTWPTTN